MDTNLDRTNLKISLEELKDVIETNYTKIDNIIYIDSIKEGYEDANFFINTINKKYVLKIFASFRSKKNIYDYVKIINECEKLDIHTLKIIPSKSEQILEYKNTYFMVSEFIEGNNFIGIEPKINEISELTRLISRINSLNFPIDSSDDEWGNNNLIREFENSKDLDGNVLHKITPVIDNLKSINFSSFKKGVIHGDLQKKHVIKNKNGLHIIDFGCARNDYLIYEISTFVAWFCLSPENIRDYNKIVNLVLDEYQKQITLTKDEINSIDILIKAAYCAYYLKTYNMMQSGDKNQETLDWHLQAKSMLDLLN